MRIPFTILNSIFPKYIIACIFIHCFSISIQGQSLNEYQVSRTDTTIVIDGLLNESPWKAASFTKDFLTLKGNTAGTVTKAKMLWDSSYLYMAFIVEDHSIWSTLKGRDVELWNQDVIEIFIDPNGDGLDYMELGFSPNGNLYDYLIKSAPPKIGMIDIGWKMKGITNKVQINGTINSKSGATEWICEIAIPFTTVDNSPKDLKRPAANDSWRVNLCRVDFDYKNSESARFYAWNSTNGVSFHIPAKFGKIIFRESIPPKK